MFSTELKKLVATMGDKRLFLTVPTSLFATLKGNGEIVNPYYRDEAEERLSVLKSELEISASFNLSSDAARLKYAFLYVPRLDTEAEVIFNGKTVLNAKGDIAVSADVSGLAVSGTNTVLIKLPASEQIRDVTLFEELRFFAFKYAHISDVSANPVFTENGVSVDVSVNMIGKTDEIKAVATLISPAGKIYYGGVTNGKTVINVPDPLLWSPKGYGNQNVYQLRVNIYYDNEVVDSKDTTLGFRKLVLDDRRGASFTVNDMEMFAMGAEYVAEGCLSEFDMFSRAASLISAASLANMNFIRFIGNGRYPSDEFLKLCDIHGIAIECIVDDKTFAAAELGALKRGISFNFSRLSEHPCVFSVAYVPSLIDPERTSILKEVMESVLPSVILRQIGEEDEFVKTVASLPDFKTLSAVCEKDDLNMFSPVMRSHTVEANAAVEMISVASHSYRYADGFEELVYTSGISNARENEVLSDLKRVTRTRYGSVVISSLNDSSPSLSYALIDYADRLKVTYYKAKQIFAPVRISVERDGKYGVTFILSNESKRAFSGVVEMSLKNALNKQIFKSTLEVTADRFSSARTHSVDLTEYIAGHEREYYVEYILCGEMGKIFSGAYLFVAPAYYDFAKPEILCEISGSGREFVLTCTSSALAKDVLFGFDKIDAVFEQNCIDITDESVRRIPFVTAENVSAERLMAELSVTSVYNIGRK